MIQIKLEDFKKMCSNAVGYVNKVYLHWTGVGYDSINHPDYHVVIGKTGNYMFLIMI